MCWQERKAQEKPHLSVSPPAALAPTGGGGGGEPLCGRMEMAVGLGSL